ncbi:MAG: hypothetical protein FWE36_08950 [Erysipelotrichales bacterium]|nr:hypothetical protein [Erysipelotrichales bacterium]
MKALCIFFLFLILLSCNSKEKDEKVFTESNRFSEEIGIVENRNKNEIIADHSIEKLFNVDFNPGEPHWASFDDEDMVQNITIIYRSESDVIENISEIEPNQIVNEVLDKPFVNIDSALLLSAFSRRAYFNGIDELLNIFGISPSQELIEEFNSFKSYRRIKISINNLNIYVYRDMGTFFKLTLIEYDKNYYYEPILKIGYNKTDIIELLGMPSAYSTERNVLVYISHRTLRQISIFFDDDENIKLVHLIAFGGI